jgi:hypothetical protein
MSNSVRSNIIFPHLEIAMVAHHSHPTREELGQFVLGLAPPDELRDLEHHLSRCTQCCQAVQDAPPSDPFLSSLRAGYRDQRTPSVERPRACRPREALWWRTLLAPPTQPQHVGRLDHYEVLELLGSGSMGLVFKARDPQLGRLVAVKMMAPELADNAAARQRFAREAQAAAMIHDAHVVHVHALNLETQLPYLVMEYVPGRTLDQRLQEGPPLTIKDIIHIGLETARGLAAAHAQGLVHRDVKPSNILLREGNLQVKVGDFGLARASLDTAGLTRTGIVAGTPLYMSPEQAEGQPVDTRSDLFSLGSVLYTMCAGQPAFQADSPLAVLKRVCGYTPAPVQSINAEVPNALATLIDRLLAKDPAQRVQSATEVIAQLKQLLIDTLGQHTRSAAPALPAPLTRPLHRRGSALAAAAAVALMLINLLGWRFSAPASEGPARVAAERRDCRLEVVADDLLQDLSRFATIRDLNLNMSTCDDAAVAHVAKLTQLEGLGLWGTPITNASIAALSNLGQLKSLDIRGTKITLEGARRLQQALPRCEIMYP